MWGMMYLTDVHSDSVLGVCSIIIDVYCICEYERIQKTDRQKERKKERREAGSG